MEYNQFYLVTGVFFEEGKSLGIGNDSKIGSRVKSQDVVKHCLFSGVISTHQHVGALKDHYGDSTLVVTKIAKNIFEFTKSYDSNKGKKIHYTFYGLKDNEFAGEWTSQGKKGTARCFLIKIKPEEFFDYQATQRLVETFLPIEIEMEKKEDDLPF